MREQCLFDWVVSQDAKDQGMARAANANTDLEKAREIARELCQIHGSCDADQVGRLLFDRYGITSLGPAAGSIFKSGEFEPTGEYVRSARKTNHRRMLFKWRLKNGHDAR